MTGIKNRTPIDIKRDMLDWAKQNLYIRSSDEWGYETIDADPLIHLLVGACASEAKLVYDAIGASDDRLLQRLLRYLLPEAFHLPQPAYAIARASATTPRCSINPDNTFYTTNEKEQYCFTPLFETTLLNGAIRFIGTDGQIIEKGKVYPTGPLESVSRLLIGIETEQLPEHLNNIAFYFDWKGNAVERRNFLNALSKSQWFWNDHALKRRVGLFPESVSWQEHFDTERQMQRKVGAQYRLNFSVITDETPPVRLEANVGDILKLWMANNAVNPSGVADTEQWDKMQGNFIWLRINLPYNVTLTDVANNMVFDINYFPVVNRQIRVKDDGDTYFAKSNGFETIRIPSNEDLFGGITAVKNEITGDPIPAVSLAQLVKNPDQMAYSIRLGGVGRSDDLNTWERMSYILSVFRNEQRNQDLADRLGDKMSLEELHEVLGSRISKSEAALAEATAAPPVYLFLQPGRVAGQIRVSVKYWTTAGEIANNLRPGTALVAQPAIPGFDTGSTRLVTTTIGAKNKQSATQQTQAMQDALFRRGRIVSANDVKSLCRLKMGERLKDISLRHIFETDLNAEGGVRRVIEVSLMVNDPMSEEALLIAQEIEFTLQENSIGMLPFKIVIK